MELYPDVIAEEEAYEQLVSNSFLPKRRTPIGGDRNGKNTHQPLLVAIISGTNNFHHNEQREQHRIKKARKRIGNGNVALHLEGGNGAWLAKSSVGAYG